MMETLDVKVKNLSYTYPDGTVGMKDITFEVKKGQSVVLMGANGTGKSTLLLCLAGIYTGQGSIELFGEKITKENIYKMRQRIGMVFQNPDDQLFSPTVLEDLIFAPINFGIEKQKAIEMGRYALKLVRMQEFESRLPLKLSYGQKKRIAIAISLVMQPDLLLLDEPLSGIDPRCAAEIVDIIWEMKENDKTIIATTHQPYFAEEIADRLIIFNEAKTIERIGEVHEVLKDKEFLKRMNLLHIHHHRHRDIKHIHDHQHGLDHAHS